MADETPKAPKGPTPDDARRAELERQADVRKAVDQANRRELPKLGGPTLNPGG